MIQTVALALFVFSALVTVYIYFGYPLLLLLMAKLRPRPIRRGDDLPSMSLVVPLFNEERLVARKIANSLSLDYPPELLELLIVSDGSTDRTNDVARSYSDARIRLLELERSGKAAALNAGAVAARGDVLVLTDGNVDLAPDSLRRLAACFSDPDVGGVSGRKKTVVRRGGDTTEKGENLYWRWDQWQKELESRIGSIFAADGTFYALRRGLYVPIDDLAQADDIAISTRVVLQGKRLVFERDAVAYEEAPVEGRDEFRRKVRVTNHSVRALLNLRSALVTSGFYSLELLSHKLIRHLIPFFLILMLATSAILASASPFFRLVLALQLAFYALAIAGMFLRHRETGATKMFAVPYYFCLVNAAAFLGVVTMLRGERVRAWSPRGA